VNPGNSASFWFITIYAIYAAPWAGLDLNPGSGLMRSGLDVFKPITKLVFLSPLTGFCSEPPPEGGLHLVTNRQGAIAGPERLELEDQQADDRDFNTVHF